MGLIFCLNFVSFRKTILNTKHFETTEFYMESSRFQTSPPLFSQRINTNLKMTKPMERKKGGNLCIRGKLSSLLLTVPFIDQMFYLSQLEISFIIIMVECNFEVGTSETIYLFFAENIASLPIFMCFWTSPPHFFFTTNLHVLQ